MDILYIVLIFSIGWFAGQWYMAYQLKKSITRIAEKYGMTFDEWADSFNQALDIKVIKLPKLFTEYVGNNIFLYNKDTGKFICQGKSLDELAEGIKENKIEAAIVFDKEQELFYIDGKIKSSTE